MLQYGVAVPFGDSEQDVVTARVPVEVMLQAARRMMEPHPPADLGLLASLAENGRSSSSGLHPRSVLQRSVRGQQAGAEEFSEEESPSSGLISAGAAAVVSGTPAPPLAAQFGLQDLIDEVPEPRNWHLWARTHGLWIGIAVLALGMGASFAVRWLAPSAPSTEVHHGSQLVGQP